MNANEPGEKEYFIEYRARLTVFAYVKVNASSLKEAYAKAPNADRLEEVVHPLVWKTPEREEINPDGADICYPCVEDIEFNGILDGNRLLSWSELECS